MRLSRVIPAIMAMITLAACQTPAGDLQDSTLATLAAAPPPPARAIELPSNRVLLKAATPEAAARAVAESRGRVVDRLPWLGVQVIELPEATAEAMARRLSHLPGVLYAEADVVVRLTAPPPGKGWNKEPTPEPTPTPSTDSDTGCAETNDPNDPAFNASRQWGLGTIQAQTAWDGGFRSSTDVHVAILDTGIDQDHEDLGKIVSNHNFTRSRTHDDRYGHGTHVAGIAAGATANCVGIAGTGFHARLVNIKVLDDNGSGYHSWIASGLHEAVVQGAEIANLSLGGPSGTQTLHDAVKEAHAAGVLVVAAAGNSSGSTPIYPAAYDEVIAVSATGQNDQRASFSNAGAEVAAPGVDIYSTLPNHDNKIGVLNYASLNGTSMAAPFVAGAAAVLWPLEEATLSGEKISDRVRLRLRKGAVGESTGSAYGRIDLSAMVN